MRTAVVALSDPLAQDLLELVDEVVREVLGVRAAAVHVGALVARQSGEEVLTDGPKDALDRGLVGRLVGPGRLDADP